MVAMVITEPSRAADDHVSTAWRLSFLDRVTRTDASALMNGPKRYILINLSEHTLSAIPLCKLPLGSDTNAAIPHKG